MIIDKQYCMSSFLMYRIVVDRNRCFSDKYSSPEYDTTMLRKEIGNSFELEEHLRNAVHNVCSEKKVALALSGGIDSAVLAKFMPAGSTAYTFRCVVPGKKVTDESSVAANYARECGLNHNIINIYWEDFEKYSSVIMDKKQAPIHSIEVQIYKAALQAKEDGFDALIYGETADCVYGGHSSLLSQDWTIGDFADRWTFVKPYKVLKDNCFIMEPYKQYEVDGYIDVPSFLTSFEYYASLNSYKNATELADIELIVPYATTIMRDELDLPRVRKGENKYLIREIFERLYPGMRIPEKTPMPRPMGEWLANWDGPKRKEFWPHCINGMTGDQKWLVWALEKFLDMIDD